METIGGTRLASFYACDDGSAKTKPKFAPVSRRFDRGKIWLALKVARPAILHAIFISQRSQSLRRQRKGRALRWGLEVASDRYIVRYYTVDSSC
jgi:hypothetical protein